MSIREGKDNRLPVKGEVAEGCTVSPAVRAWAGGKHPADCHTLCGALS